MQHLQSVPSPAQPVTSIHTPGAVTLQPPLPLRGVQKGQRQFIGKTILTLTLTLPLPCCGQHTCSPPTQSDKVTKGRLLAAENTEAAALAAHTLLQNAPFGDLSPWVLHTCSRMLTPPWQIQLCLSCPNRTHSWAQQDRCLHIICGARRGRQAHRSHSRWPMCSTLCSSARTSHYCSSHQKVTQELA